MIRAASSLPPPGSAVTIRTGFTGYGCPKLAAGAIEATAAQISTNADVVRRSGVRIRCLRAVTVVRQTHPQIHVLVHAPLRMRRHDDRGLPLLQQRRADADAAGSHRIAVVNRRILE